MEGNQNQATDNNAAEPKTDATPAATQPTPAEDKK